MANDQAVDVAPAIAPWVGIIFIMGIVVGVEVRRDLLDSSQLGKFRRFAVGIMGVSGSRGAGCVVGPDLDHHVLNDTGGLYAEIRAVHHMRVGLGKQCPILGKGVGPAVAIDITGGDEAILQGFLAGRASFVKVGGHPTDSDTVALGAIEKSTRKTPKVPVAGRVAWATIDD